MSSKLMVLETVLSDEKALMAEVVNASASSAASGTGKDPEQEQERDKTDLESGTEPGKATRSSLSSDQASIDGAGASMADAAAS